MGKCVWNCGLDKKFLYKSTWCAFIREREMGIRCGPGERVRGKQDFIILSVSLKLFGICTAAS